MDAERFTKRYEKLGVTIEVSYKRKTDAFHMWDVTIWWEAADVYQHTLYLWPTDRRQLTLREASDHFASNLIDWIKFIGPEALAEHFKKLES